MKALIVGDVSERILPMITFLESEGVEIVYDSGKDTRGFKFDYVIVDELVSETLSDAQAENIKRTAFLHTLNFDKTNFIVRENVEI